MISDVMVLLFSFYWEFDNACFIFLVDSFKYSSQFPLQRKWKCSWVFSDNAGVFSPTVTEPSEVSVVSDEENSSQLREERRTRRLKAQQKLRKFHDDGIVSSPSLERAVSLIQVWNVTNNVNTNCSTLISNDNQIFEPL
jgi:hypothetical protein